ncbi:MAG: glycosyltransferase family 4 protein [Pirellulaceae bacterium]
MSEHNRNQGKRNETTCPPRGDLRSGVPAGSGDPRRALGSFFRPFAQRRARVLQLAYACSPYKGSEPGVGWNRAVQAARYSDVWVVCEGGEFRPHMEHYFRANGDVDGLNVLYVPKTSLERRLSAVPGLYYLAYNRWHRRVFRFVQNLHAEIRFDLTHQVNMCGYREPGYLCQLDVPLVWGPIGGTQNHPWRNLDQAGLIGGVQETLRSVLNASQLRFSRRVHRAAHRADLLLAANSTVQRHFASVVGRPGERMCETGIHVPQFPSSLAERDGPLRVLWAGEFRAFKALPMLLKALAEIRGEVDFQLRVVGDGPQRKRWLRLARQWGLEDRVTWTGWLSHQETLRQYEWADLFAFTSLRDTTGSVIFEALSNGVPVIAPNHQGAGDIVTPDSGIPITVRATKEMIADYRQAIQDLAADPAKRMRLRRGAVRRAQDYAWDEQGRRMRDYYRELLGEGFDWSDRRCARPIERKVQDTSQDREVVV